MEIASRIIVFILGAGFVLWTLHSAIRSFVLPRSENVFLTRVVSQAVFQLFRLRLRSTSTYKELYNIDRHTSSV